MSTQRDELAMELFIVDNHKQSREQSVVDWEWFTTTPKFGVRVENYKTTADGLLAAGWTKPRTVTTAEELHGLPLGSVIIDSDPSVLQMLEKSAIGGAEWAQPNEERIYSSGHVTLPATVLYEPTA